MRSKLHEFDLPALKVVDVDLAFQPANEGRDNTAKARGGIDLWQEVGDEAVPSEDSEGCGIVQAFGSFWTGISTSS